MSTLPETAVCSGVEHPELPVYHSQLSPPRPSRRNNLVAETMAEAPHDARAIAIGVGGPGAVAQPDIITTLKYLVVLRKISSYVRTNGIQRG